ncbi:helix-turn-helix transcriptional regulator [Actinacidiphila oryziradicis]|uniref:helix-turn-helix transcriptional regulator n=1 Tax=Actinacidiphila oryziradicis TaxID=2571141 RepID=UPI0023EF98F2|nr:helix-turn-helix transcriptional regulator [Actinacidiphila oryziradicis]MCW2875085.1 response regulator receiver protein [Actinacidiphila oryziradicis]
MPEEQRLYTAALSRIAAAEAELAEVRDVVTALAAGPPQQPRSWPPDLAEILYGRAEQEHRIDQLQREARKEVLTFVRPPYVMQGNPVQEERLAAGIVYRSLYENSALTHPGATELPGFVPPGEQARATPRVPLKLMIVDNEHALLPLVSGHSDFTSGGLLLLHQSVVLDALIELFEDRWLRGTPLRFPAGDPDPGLPISPALDAQLLSLLMSGLPDKAIAGQLGISLRTLQRRIRGLMESTGTANRTQLAWYVAQQRLA